MMLERKKEGREAEEENKSCLQFSLSHSVLTTALWVDAIISPTLQIKNLRYRHSNISPNLSTSLSPTVPNRTPLLSLPHCQSAQTQGEFPWMSPGGGGGQEVRGRAGRSQVAKLGTNLIYITSIYEHLWCSVSLTVKYTYMVPTSHLLELLWG